MDPIPEKQKSSEKKATTKKDNLPNRQHFNDRIDLKNNKQMQNHEFQCQQTLRTESIGDLRQFEYSFNSSYSLHSHFSSAEKIEQTKTEKEIQTSKESPQINRNKLTEEESCRLIEPRQIDFLNNEEQTSQGNFMKNKVSIDSQELEKIINEINKFQKEEKPEQCIESGGLKSYTSCLLQVVDKNQHKSQAWQLQENQIQKSGQILIVVQPQQQRSQSITKSSLEKIPKSELNQKQQIPREKPLIRPIQIIQDKPETSKQSQKSPIQQKNKKQMRQQLEIRRIPSTLCESYDYLLLTVNNNQKALGKDNLISPIKLKDKSHPAQMNKKKSKENQKYDDSPKLNDPKRPDRVQTNLKKTTVDEELLVSLPIVEGYCQLKKENSQLYETKFFINKNTICFQTFKQILINGISKIKFIEKDEKQITVKVTYESESNVKSQNFLINLLTESSETYFFQSYDFFSQIVLRKLLLMKLTINELNERYEIESPIRSPQSSPLSSPLSLPSILPRKPSQHVEIEGSTLLQSNLYKKSTFFSSWEKKYFELTSKCLQSYACSPINGQKQKPSTQLSKTSEIWTRFELIYGYLVVKMWQSKIEKFQIGIPLCDFTNSEGKNNWLYGLSKNLVWRKNLVNDKKIKTNVGN